MIVRVIRQWQERRKKQRYAATVYSLREHLLFFGCDTSHLTDEELEQRVLSISTMVAKSGITTEKAAQSVVAFRDAYDRVGHHQ